MVFLFTNTAPSVRLLGGWGGHWHGVQQHQIKNSILLLILGNWQSLKESLHKVI